MVYKWEILDTSTPTVSLKSLLSAEESRVRSCFLFYMLMEPFVVIVIKQIIMRNNRNSIVVELQGYRNYSNDNA